VVIPALFVANYILLFISSAVSFLSAHSQICSNISRFHPFAAQCQAVIHESALDYKNLCFISCVVNFFSAHSHNFCFKGFVPRFIAQCQTVIPALSVANKKLFLSPFF